MNIKKYLRLSNLTTLLVFLMISVSHGQNIKVFILAGQSNMQGHGDVLPENINGTLAHFMANGGDQEFNYVQDATGNWNSLDDVWVRYDHEEGELLTGVLDVGFGASNNQIGPEFGFGHRVGQQTDEHILIVKTCWGGKNLAVDFRPPSSGGTTGTYYNLMINDVNAAINNIITEFPQFMGGAIEIAGMTWFQGWNDGEEQSYMDGYTQNLINLINDVRTDLNVPNLPFVIGLTGNGGLELEPAGTWINNLQTQIVPAQINAATFEGFENVAYVDTRTFWRDGEDSPEPDFLHHWNNNGESYLRIGDALGVKMNELLGQSNNSGGGESLGFIQPSTNLALPSAYNFQEYVFPEPNDQGSCEGIQNTTATINDVFLAQTHRHAIGHPLLFTIGERPALLQIAVTGSGASPDVKVEGVLNGNILGTLCLNGPENLSQVIDLEQPNFSDYFSVTLPKSWIKQGLELRLSAGNDMRILDQDDLQITPFTELNLVLFNMDIMDYNHEPHRTPIFNDFLQEVASAIPASVVRFGIFPETLRLPSMAIRNQSGLTVVVDKDEMVEESDLNLGQVNYAANEVIANMQQSLGDTPNTIYFGNTLNLDPGGWGGSGSFVSFDYTDVFIHELGHALSLPHWSEDYRITDPEPWNYSYPYEGEEGEGSGRGEAWNFIQDKYEFVSPKCQDNSGVVGTERSDCMQRGFGCIESRSYGTGPWDGFGDFSAKAINNYLLGSENSWGQVEDRGEIIDYHLRENDGHPIANLVNGERVFTRHPSQPQNTYAEEFIKLPGTEQIEQDVYLIYGSAHATLPEANIIYDPIKYRGTLLPIIDPTDANMFSVLQNMEFEDAPEFYQRSRDITLKVTYIDGSELHAIVPFQSFNRVDPEFPDEDIVPSYFSIAVPGDKLICGVELYHRDFIVTDESDDYSGNINDPSQNITADNFMDEAVLMRILDHSCNCPGTPDYVEPGTPCDDGNPLTVDDVEDGFCNCEGIPIAPCGLIDNGQFQESLEGWWTWGAETSVVDGEVRFENIVLGDAGLAQGPLVLDNDFYKIEFEAYASQARSIDIIVFLDAEPYTEYYRETVNLTTTREAYELTFFFSENTTLNGALEFFIGNEDSDLFLDNVCFDINQQVLPVTFLSFNGELNNDEILLTWEVEDEINVSHYVVERANDQANMEFTSLGDVAAIQQDEYMYIDDNPNLGVNYYRIRTVDLDGHISYSETIAIDYDTTIASYEEILKDLILSPNPVQEKLYLSIGELVEIVDLKGTKYTPSLDVANLEAGMYIAIIKLNNITIPKKFVKL